MSDGQQSLHPAQFAQLMERLRPFLALLGKVSA
jgi:hypothetical protein